MGRRPLAPPNHGGFLSVWMKGHGGGAKAPDGGGSQGGAANKSAGGSESYESFLEVVPGARGRFPRIPPPTRSLSLTLCLRKVTIRL